MGPGELEPRQRGAFMKKSIVVVLIIAVAVTMGVALRSTNRADAAAGNCYSDSQGPTTPTICN